MAAEDLESLEPLLPPDKPDVGAHPAACPVIGLGASAGGLEAFQAFLKALPADLGYAYVLVQHLDPNHESMLAELLSRRTTMPVRQVVDGMVIEPNAVYLIPPNHSLTIEKISFSPAASAVRSMCSSAVSRPTRVPTRPASCSQAPAVTVRKVCAK